MFAAIGHRWCAKIRKGLVYATLLQLVVLGLWNEAALQEMVGYVGLGAGMSGNHEFKELGP